MFLGAHLSRAEGLVNMVDVARKIDSNTFQFFISPPKSSRVANISERELRAFHDELVKFDFGPVVVHAPYVVNLCTSNDEKRQNIVDLLTAETQMLDKFIPGNLYVVHPGNHVGQGINVGIDRSVNILRNVVGKLSNTHLLIETMAGKGTEICTNFDEVKNVLDNVNSDKVGVCLDTCHIFSAGYDITKDPRSVLDEFDKIIGINRLKSVHMSDSMHPFGARKDRHATIGNGFIGLKALVDFIKVLPESVPVCLETPTDDIGHGDEIKLIKDELSRREL